MSRRNGFVLVLLFVIFPLVTHSAFGLSGDSKLEFDQFIRNLREEKRIDRIGYLISMELSPSKTNENKVLSLTGKFSYSFPKGYLTHVNFARLERVKKAGVTFQILDKKRLDDSTEQWYLVWVENEEKAKALKAKFEPLFTHEHTVVIRIRPSDEEFLMDNRYMYSVIEEAMLPLKVPVDPLPKKFLKVDPAIQEAVKKITEEELVAVVQTLQDCVSRKVKSAGNASATTWLADEFKKIASLTVSTPTFESSYGKMSNVVAEKPGLIEPKKVIVVCGHFDSTAGYSARTAPGADDNGTGAAGVLALARVTGPMSLPYTVVFACMNAEEIGLVGSKAFAKRYSGSTEIQILGVLNMDMIADKDDNEVAVIGNTRSNWLINLFKDTALAYVGLTSKPLYDSNIWYSDHSSFWNIGASAILTIEGYPEISAYYHSENDLVKNLAPSFMEKVARANLATLLTMMTATTR